MPRNGPSRPRTPRTPRLPVVPEREVLAEVLDCLALLRIPAWRCNTGAARVGTRLIRFGQPGMPDVLGILPAHDVYPAGRLLAVEVKRSDGGRVSVAQAAWHAWARRAGALVLVATSVQDVQRGLEEAGFSS